MGWAFLFRTSLSPHDISLHYPTRNWIAITWINEKGTFWLLVNACNSACACVMLFGLNLNFLFFTSLWIERNLSLFTNEGSSSQIGCLVLVPTESKNSVAFGASLISIRFLSLCLVLIVWCSLTGWGRDEGEFPGVLHNYWHLHRRWICTDQASRSSDPEHDQRTIYAFKEHLHHTAMALLSSMKSRWMVLREVTLEPLLHAESVPDIYIWCRSTGASLWTSCSCI